MEKLDGDLHTVRSEGLKGVYESSFEHRLLVRYHCNSFVNSLLTKDFLIRVILYEMTNIYLFFPVSLTVTHLEKGSEWKAGNIPHINS